MNLPLQLASCTKRMLADAAWAAWERKRTTEEVEPGALEAELPPGHEWDGQHAVVFRPWWYRAPKWGGKAQAKRVASGLHPTGWPLHPRALWRGQDRALCRTCKHHRREGQDSRSWRKCALVERSHQFGTGPSGDLRAAWGACARWEAA